MGERETGQGQPGQRESVYSSFWDWYVNGWYDQDPRAVGRHHKGRDLAALEWPGDEWGNPDYWRFIFEQLFEPAGVESWERAVEIGPGSGKHTLQVIQASEATVRAYDVSEQFLGICQQRCAEELKAGRLELQLLDPGHPSYMLSDISKRGWRGRLDAVYSIAAMVHVDLQYLIVYLLTAALALKPGGKLVMTLATATNEGGFEKLLGDIKYFWTSQSDPGGSAKYEWLSAEMVESILRRLGFDLDVIADHPHRDLHLVASLNDPEVARALEPYLFPEMKQPSSSQ